MVQIGDVQLPPTSMDMPPQDLWTKSETSSVRCPDPAVAYQMEQAIASAREEGDTLGGIIQVIATGLPAGMGSFVHFDRKLDGRIGQMLLSLPSIKGVEIGAAWEGASLRGSEVHDPIRIVQGKLLRSSNRCGGLEGGVTTGESLWVRVACKPIATLRKGLDSVDLHQGEPTHARYQRSDVCAVPRAVPIVEAMVAFVLADALLERLGGDTIQEVQERFQRLPQLNLSSFSLNRGAQKLW